ncbi:MAG: DUF6883 domain-containing protein [Phycisphaerales bacterium]
MRLPNVEDLIIPDLKLAGYLLAPAHEYGRGKALFFLGRGFSAESLEEFRRSLERHARQNNIVTVDQTAFGVRYRIEGPLVCPDGSTPIVRVIWFIERGEDAPRLVTAYPISPRPSE